MADRLTQLQDAIDQLATIYYCAIRYVGWHHDFVPTGTEAKVKDDTLQSDPPEVFHASQQELARDLVMKTKQIELLIASLPGIGVSEAEQQERLRRLEGEIEEAERERVKSIEEKEELMRKMDSVIRSLRRV